jgi:predicted acylesterase/phospholipase RssA
MKAWRLVDTFDWHRIGHIAFAGGGNRCWWQGGVCDALVAQGHALPRHFSGTSAGIAIAAALAGGTAHDALAPCTALYESNRHWVDRRALMRGQWRFAHQHIFPAWLRSFVTAARWQRARERGHELHIAVSRFRGPTWPGLACGLGMAAYLVDKYLLRQVHPVLPRHLGFGLEFLRATGDTPHTEVQRLLLGAAAAAPIIQSPWIGGAMAFDGGFCDNAPVAPLSAATTRGADQILVLLTRHHPRLPGLFAVADRIYWQPSHAVKVSTLRCTAGTDVVSAYQHGQQDAQAWMAQGLLRPP